MVVIYNCTSKSLCCSCSIMNMVITEILLLVIFCCGFNATVYSGNPDIGLNAKQLIRKHGYPLEVHSIESEDGYILETHRMPYGRYNKNVEIGPSVLIVPGLLSDSADFLTLGPGFSLGYMLADEGFDVWIANYRGTRWSRKHKTLSPIYDRKKFFDMSFQEVGLYDITANIDHILNTTNHKQLFYIGHSQGTTSAFTMLSSKPEYNNKIRSLTALGPVVYTTHINHIVFSFVKRYLPVIQKQFESNKIYELFRYSPLTGLLGASLCADNLVTQPLCAEVFYFICGYSTIFNKTLIPLITSNSPAGGTTRMFYHYIQIARSGQFQLYNFGKQENIRRYGYETPPKLELTKVTVPITIYHGDRDVLATIPDVELLVSDLPNVVNKHLLKGYNHVDYLWGSNVDSVLYSEIIKSFKSYSV